MTGIYWTKGEARIKKYGASITGAKTVIRIELETEDHFEAGSILASIERAKAEQAQTADPVRKPRRALQSPTLRLTHQGSNDQ